MKRQYSVKETMELWAKTHPETKISRTTLYNWGRKFGWVLNEDRILMRQKLSIDADKFDKFNNDPTSFLSGGK